MAQSPQQSQTPDAEHKRIKSESREPIGKVVELIGNSKESWDDAVRSAVTAASETIEHITGVEVQKMSAEVKDGEIVEYRVDLKLAFGVERSR